MALTLLAETSVHSVPFFFSMNCYQRRWCCDRSRNASYLLRPGSGVCGPCSHWTWIFHQMMEWCWVHPTRWAAGESGSIWLMVGNLGGTVMLHLPLWQELFPKESLYIVESAWTAPNSMRTLRWFHPLGGSSRLLTTPSCPRTIWGRLTVESQLVPVCWFPVSVLW